MEGGRTRRGSLNLIEATRLVGQLAVTATLIGLAIVVVRELSFRAIYENRLGTEFAIELFEANALVKDDVIVLDNTMKRRVLRCIMQAPLTFLPMLSFFAIGFRFYLGSKHWSVRGHVAALVFTALFLVVGYGVLRRKWVLFLHPLLGWALGTLVLKFTLPTDSKIAEQMAYQIIIGMLGTLSISLLQYFPRNKDSFTVLLFGVIYPFFREVTRYLATRSAWYLSFRANIGGKLIPEDDIDRKHAWVFAGWTQIFWAIYFRFQVTNMSSGVMSFVVICYQALLEIVLRLSVAQRDALITKFMRGVRRRRLVRSVTKIYSLDVRDGATKTTICHSEASGEILADEALYQDARRSFYSMVIFTDMMAEYSGIVISCFAVAFWKEHPLFIPFSFYSNAVLANEKTDARPLYAAAAMQLAGEFVVDVICVYFEKQRDPVAAKQKIVAAPKSFLFLYCSLTLATYAFALSLVNFADNFNECEGKNMCHCMDKGLVKGGVRDSYCAMLANSTN